MDEVIQEGMPSRPADEEGDDVFWGESVCRNADDRFKAADCLVAMIDCADLFVDAYQDIQMSLILSFFFIIFILTYQFLDQIRLFLFFLTPFLFELLYVFLPSMFLFLLLYFLLVRLESAFVRLQ
jgi:hypothetical protein